MNFDAHFRMTSYALVATAFAALALTGELYAVAIILYSIAFAVSFYRDARGASGFILRDWMWRALTVAYLPFFFFDALALTSKVSAIIHLTLFASAVKLYQNKRDRDWVFLYLIAFFQMLLAAGLTFNAVFVASLALFVFFFVSTLAAFEIRRTQREVAFVEEEIIMRAREPRWFRRRAKQSPSADPNKQTGLLRTRYLMGVSLAQVAMVAALTLPLFFLIPRFGGGGIVRGLGNAEAITGFSEVVRLGDVAGIKSRQNVAMRIQLDRAPQKFMRWRGIALDKYDGRAWSLDSAQSRRQGDAQSRNNIAGDASTSDEEFIRRYGVGEPPSDKSSLIEQRIVLEPVSMGTLFAAHRLVELHGPMPNLSVVRDTSVKRGDDAASVSTEIFRRRISYIAKSDLRVPSERELRADADPSYSEEVKRFYINQLPRSLDPRIQEFAREVTRSAATPYDKARALENFFKTSFSYSLNVKRTDRDPLAEFLFETREGHCEYFATAMAITLRTLGIPARIVNGFQMGEYNDINNLYTVRDADAHSWVEVYFPKADAWVEFDPTPPAGINDYTQGGFMSRLRKYMEAAEVFWLDYIVTLDSDEQASIMVELQQRTLAMKDQLVAYYMDFKLWMKNTANRLLIEHEWSIGDLLLLAGLILVLGLAVIGVNILRSHRKGRKDESTGYGPWWHRLFVLPTWRRSRLGGRDHRASAVLFYEQMLTIAARGGLVKPPDQTPAEFAAVSRFDQIREITAVYNRVRFGGARLNETETRQVSSLLAALRRAVREKSARRK